MSAAMKILLGCLCVFAVAAARLEADQVTLKNGDRVTGSIVKKDATTLTVNSVHFGTITMPWAEVDSLQTDGSLFVSVSGARAVQGSLSISGGQAQVGGRSVAASEITVIRNAAEEAAYDRMLAPGWTELWAGNASLGWAGTAGNARTQTFTLGVNAARVTNTDKTMLYFTEINSSARINGLNTNTASAVRGGLAYNHNISGRAFVNVFNDDEHDRFQDLDLRFVVGGGLGYSMIKTDRKRLDLLGGLAYTREKFSISPNRNSANAYWGDDYSLKWSKATSLVQSFRMFNNLSDGGDYRANFDLGSTTKLGSRFTWNLTLSDRYVHHPAAQAKTNDILYSTGLGLTFSR